MTAPAWSRDGAAIRLSIRLTPRARRDEITGLVEIGEGASALAVRVSAPPVGGGANKALADYLALRLGLPKSAVTIASGEKSRLKILRLERCTDDAIQRLLDLVGEGKPQPSPRTGFPPK
jgi:uncharacterized protein (TIGR00251 family)